jgi:hypothetical protein
MKPIVEPLSYWRRKLIFGLLLGAFLLSLPVFIFYATGYRYDFFSDKPSITATGGLYLAAEALESTIFLDEIEVTNARVFRNASYIQGLQPGMHRVHVQTPGRNTWVKNLSVYPHIVTEAEAFNLPLVPQIRPVTEYQTVRGEAVFVVASSTLPIFSFASSSVPLFISTSTATSTYRLNPEYVLVKDLFAEQASTTAMLLKIEKSFSFATTTIDLAKEAGTTTVTRDNLSLYKSGDDVFVEALGVGRQIPHYFCTNQVSTTSSPDLKLGASLSEVVEEELIFQDNLNEIVSGERECRTTIRIDRRSQTVHDFDFFPDNEDLVILTLDDGLYVIEIDDRAWQNAQVLYPGQNLKTLVHGGGIFVKDGNKILEALTDIIVP